MANDASSSLGLRPFNQPYGNRRIGVYKANTAQAIYLYQPVALNNSGQVAVAALADLTEILGTAVGFLDSNKAAIPSDNLTTSAAPNLAASKDGYVLVTDDPQQLYILEEDTGGSALTASNVGNTGDFVYLATTGNTTTGIANVVLDRSTVAAGTGGIFQLLAVADNVNSDGSMNAVGDNGKWIVKIFHHQLVGKVGTPV